MQAAKAKVVILGGGFAGVRVALDLSAAGNFEVILIDNKTYHIYHADLYKLIDTATDLEKRTEFEQLEGTVNIPFQKIFQGKKVHFFQALVEEVDFEAQIIKTNKDRLPFDFLVIALGSQTAFFNIPGAADFSHPFKTTGDALNVRNDLIETIPSKANFKIIIAGGGFTGVELAGSVCGLIKKLQAENPAIIAEVEIIEAATNLLSGMPEWAQKLALEKLDAMGVSVKLNSEVANITQQAIFLGNGTKIDYDYLIWTAGVEGMGKSFTAVELNKKGQIVVNGDLSVPNHPNVFVVGDIAASPSPPAAWAAIAEAKIVSKNIQRRNSGKEGKAFISPAPAFIVPIGKSFALTNAFGLEISGSLAVILKKIIGLRYLLSIMPFWEGLSFWWKGVKILDLNE